MTFQIVSPASDHVGPKPSSLAQLGALIGDPVRAAILLHLSDGSRRPAGELASLAGASPQAGSAHLAQLVDGGLLKVEKLGRHRFFSIASGEVADAVEGLGNWIDEPRRPSPHPADLRAGRLCYDHLAGSLGVLILDRMAERGFFGFGSDGPSLSEAGVAWCDRNGLRLRQPSGSRRPMLRLCLDWTERRHHMGGQFGAALAAKMFESGFVTAGSRPRTVLVTNRGAGFLRAELGLDLRCGVAGSQ